ncbi:hypothetical protein [Paenibacillus tundrae]|uniref:Uncharacterized protein n=1 Tax=Paenibacillus tundrae TaxID=528187 RepID=A0ABT9WDC1_9BACL|nr:hypothetical protein [Paenibacillus tundrae]MDQ0171268.1 hypothetical protein [Paenibacillus tundrae]
MIRKEFKVFLAFVMFATVVLGTFQHPQASAEESANNEITIEENWWDVDAAQSLSTVNDSSKQLTKEEVLDIAREQLENQNASQESIDYFTNLIENEYNTMPNEGITTQAQATQAATANTKQVLMKRGGEDYSQSYLGSRYIATHRVQYLPPTVTADIIDKKLRGNLTTWQHVMTALLGWPISAKFPVIGHIISAVGVLNTIDSYMTSETIRKIEASTGASRIISYNSSQGEDTLWVPWTEYPYATVSVDSQYSKNSSHVIY